MDISIVSHVFCPLFSREWAVSGYLFNLQHEAQTILSHSLDHSATGRCATVVWMTPDNGRRGGRRPAAWTYVHGYTLLQCRVQTVANREWELIGKNSAQSDYILQLTV